jgi:hypothetical protein
MNFMQGMVEFSEGYREAAVQEIMLPEVFHDFYALLLV